MRPRWKRLIWIAPLAILGMALFIFIGGQIVMHLWNWLLPPLFGWSLITFWQALGLLALCRILFGGFGFHGHNRRSSSNRPRILDRVADRIADRVNAMSPEEKERFRERMRERCGWNPSSSESKGQ
jgi:uncharacterized membrane protein